MNGVRRRAGRISPRQFLAVVGVGALILIAPPEPGASAQTVGEAFTGYSAAATGSAMSIVPALPTLLPYVDAPAEGTVALAHSTLTSGGQGYGRASTAWPGTVLAGLGPLLYNASGQDFNIPPYPLVIESREFEPARHSDMPGILMVTDVDADRADASTGVGGLILPGVLDTGALRTVSRATVDDVVRATTRATVAGIDVLGGLVRIGSVVSEATAASDGRSGSCGGRITVKGLEIAGVPARIDDEGVHIADAGLPAVIGRQVADALAAGGVTLRLVDGIGQCEGPTVSRSSGALVLEVPTPAVPPVPAGRLHVLIGLTSVAVDASPAGVLGEGTEEDGDGVPLAVDPTGLDISDVFLPDVTGVVGGGTLGGTGTPRGGAQPPLGTGAGSLLPTVATDYSFGGLPLALVLGLLAAAALVARWLRRYVDRLCRMASTQEGR